MPPPPRTPPPPVATGRGPSGEGREPRAASHASPLKVIKPGQGVHVRWGTAIGAGVIAIAAAYYIYGKIQLLDFVGTHDALRITIPVVILLALGWLVFWLVGRNAKFVDFLIATEGEMKKVNWSSRKEVWGATKVVIVTVFALATILFVVDILFIFFFSSIKVLQLDVARDLFGMGTRT